MRPFGVAAATLAVALAFFGAGGAARADDHSQDAQVGKSVFDDLRAKKQIVTDSPYQAVLQRAGRRIARAAGPQWYVERFYVVKGASPNAFSAPGGYVFVNEALLRTAENEDELANVLGHETAHLVLGHVHAKLQQQQRQNVLLKIGHLFSKSTSTGATNTFNVAQAAGNYTFLNFSRQQEYAADQRGAYLAAKAGYNPWGTVWYFQEVLRVVGDAGFEQYTQQHPSTSDRIARVEAYFKANPATFRRWHDVMTSTAGLPAGG
jgi:predicted Zn-dependent protease